MNYTDLIFKRLDIQQIRAFLLHGTECVEISAKTYEERIEEAETSAVETIAKHFQDADEYEKVTAKIFKYVNTVQEVYMEIGIQCGATLAMRLLS